MEIRFIVEFIATATCELVLQTLFWNLFFHNTFLLPPIDKVSNTFRNTSQFKSPAEGDDKKKICAACVM